MKKTFTTLLFIVLSVCFGKAQYVTIPDGNFVKYLQATFPACMSGNQMDTTCSGIMNAPVVNCSSFSIKDLSGIKYFKKLVKLNCSFNYGLDSLPLLPPHIKVLNCYGNGLNFLPVLPDSLTYFNCGANWFPALPPLPTTLTFIDMDGDGINTMPSLPPHLDTLICNGNKFTALPALPSSLVNLICRDNLLTGLPALPAALYQMDCTNNQLTSLPALPSSLVYLYCPTNQLTSVPTLPVNLVEFYCDSNKISALPALPASLHKLGCGKNNLSSLPLLPGYLNELTCRQNHISSLPALPQSSTVFFLDCSHNLLTSLPSIVINNVYYLDCSYNQLQTLPFTPLSTVTISDYFLCNNNQLSSLPNLTNKLAILNVSDNPQLTCLPKLVQFTGQAKDFSIAETGIECLSNIIQHTGSIPQIDTMPLCDLLNLQGCTPYWNIKGNLYKDGDGNCSTKGDSILTEGIPVVLYDSLNNAEQLVYVNGAGNFSFLTSLGRHTVKVDTAQIPFVVLCPSTGNVTDTLTTAKPVDTKANFREYCKPGFDLGVNGIGASSFFFPNNTIKVPVFAGDEAGYYGVTCNTTGLGGTLTARVSGPVSIAAASNSANAASSISGNTVTWSVVDFSLVDFSHTFSITLHTNTVAQAGDEVCVTAAIAATTGSDNKPANDTLKQCFEVLNSHDPNGKEVDPPGAIAPGYNGYLTYTIHFENTGTAAAQNIQIIDTISSNLDMSTFQLVAFSHATLTQVYNASHVVKFNFANINLPDSVSNKAQSTGYVQYKIKPLSNLAAGKVINNTAYIYFDFNQPVVTNTTSSLVGVLTGAANISVPANLVVYPNPAGRELFVNSYWLLVNNAEITDLLGRSVITQTIPTQAKQATIDVSSLTPGVYFITLHSVNGNVVRKFVKE